jgi:methylglyoxal reductase
MMRRVKRVRLGDVEISNVVFGTMAHGPARVVDDADARVRVMHAAFDAGIDAVDTAPLYELGRAEEIVGRAVRGHDVRVLTKVGLRWDASHGDLLFAFPDRSGRTVEVRKNSRPESIREEVEASLRRIGVDVLDVVQIHHHDPHVPVAESIGALLELRAEGKLRSIGVCNFGVDALKAAKAALGDVPLASVQDRYNLLERGIEQTVRPWARNHGARILAYSPLAEGALVGVRRLAGDDPRQDSALFSRKNYRRVGEKLDTMVRPVAHRHGVTVAQIAIAWVLAEADAAIVGASTERQAKENAEAMWIGLSEPQRNRVGATFSGFVVQPAQPASRAERVARKVQRRLSALLD